MTYELNFWQARVCREIDEAMPALMEALEPDVRAGVASVDLKRAIVAFRSNA